MSDIFFLLSNIFQKFNLNVKGIIFKISSDVSMIMKIDTIVSILKHFGWDQI